MSDFAHNDHRHPALRSHRTAESRLMYGAFYLIFLTRAALKRLLPMREPSRTDRQESIFAEARTAASVMVVSSFMGL